MDKQVMIRCANRLQIMADALMSYTEPGSNGLGVIGCKSFAQAIREVSEHLMNPDNNSWSAIA